MKIGQTEKMDLQVDLDKKVVEKINQALCNI
jgi:hypothetical protein